jgi:long-chain acyl-CoA synthetase
MRPGDHLAVLLDNEVVFFEAVWAGLRAGLYVTPINWHLTADEAGYIVADSGATALVTSAHLGETVHELGDDLAAVTTPIGASRSGRSCSRCPGPRRATRSPRS